MPKSFRPMVRTGDDPAFYGNGLRFAAEAEALDNARDLFSRWTRCVEYRADPSDDAPNYAWIDGKLVPLPAPEKSPHA